MALSFRPLGEDVTPNSSLIPATIGRELRMDNNHYINNNDYLCVRSRGQPTNLLRASCDLLRESRIGSS